MAFTIEHDVTIDRPVEEVFAVVSDPTNDPRWCPTVTSCTPDGPGAYAFAARPGPKTVRGRIEITDSNAPHRFAWKGTNEIGRFEGWYELDRIGESTRLRSSSSLELRGAARLLSPIVRTASRRTTRKQYDSLRRLLEENGHSRAENGSEQLVNRMTQH